MEKNELNGMSIAMVKVFGWENAIFGMRLPKDSELKIDSSFGAQARLGEKDLALAICLAKAGRDHRKFMRMVHIQALVKMPISWWIQYDTYKVGTVANSRSRMHKFGSRRITMQDFYVEGEECRAKIAEIIECINSFILKSDGCGDSVMTEVYWKSAVDLLPMSYLQERMIDLNYEVAVNIIASRYNERLFSEWRFFCDALLEKCEYLSVIYDAIKK